MEPDWIRKDVPIYPGAGDMDVVGPDPGTQCVLDPRTGPNRRGLSLSRTLEPRRQLSGARAQPVRFGDGRCTFEMSSPTYPELAQRRPNAGIQPVKLTPDRFSFGLPTRHT